MKTFSSKLIFIVTLAFFGAVFNLFAGEPQSALTFTENKGQWTSNILFQADFRGGRLFLEKQNLTYVFYRPEDFEYLHPHDGKVTDRIRLHAVRVELAGSNPAVQIEGSNEAGYHKNYFIGNLPEHWATDVRHFGEVRYTDIYPGIDLKVYSKANELKYDYIVSTGSDASQIKLKYAGAEKMEVKYGMLYMQLSVGTIIEGRPYAYQNINGENVFVECDYVLKGNEVGFKLGRHNYNFPVVIDPTLIFSSYTGSFAANWGFTATYDNAGDLYAGGNVQGAGYPVTVGAYQVAYGGGSNVAGNGWMSDMAIAKFNPGGTAFLYATYLGGSSNEQPHSIVVDNANNLVIYGVTWSTNYPVTAGAYDVTYNGFSDIVISKLSASGNALLASTYIGTSGDDGINIDPGFFTFSSLKYNYADESRGEIIADAANNYIIASCTRSTLFPTTAGAYQTGSGGGLQDGVVFKFNSSLTTLMWSTFLGGNGDDAAYGMQPDPSGDLYVAGGTNSSNFPTTAGTLHTTFQGGQADGFVARLSANGSSLIASTYIGTPVYDQNYFVQLDLSGNVYVCGQTQGNYPVTAGTYFNAGGKQFIQKLNSSLTTSVYSTIFGTNSPYPNISETAFLVDTCENVYISGWARCAGLSNPNPTTTFGMPITPNAIQPVTGDGCDFYFIVFKKNAVSLLYASHYGGALSDEHVDGGTSRFDKTGTIYQSACAGCFGNSDWPTTPSAVSSTNNSNFQCNNAVLKLNFDLLHPVSSFSPSPLSGCAPFVTTFLNNSVGGSNYIWDFGDGSPQDTSFSPTHTFLNPGNYNVMLVAINPFACNTSDTTYVTVNVFGGMPINAGIVFNSSGLCDTVNVNFTAVYSAGQTFSWDFGDTFTDTGIAVTHTYTIPGTYTVTLIILDTACVNSDTATVTITVNSSPPLNVVINPDTLTHCDSLSADFTVAAVANCIYAWDLGDATTASTDSVHHVYTVSGTYTVIVVVTDTICNRTASDTVTVIVPAFITPTLSLNYNHVDYCDSLVASLQAVANFGNIYSWDFGDLTSGSGTIVSHTYTTPGTYNVTLIVTDTVCQRADTAYQTVIFYPPIVASLTTDSVAMSCPPVTIALQGHSNFTGSTFQWYVDNVAVSTDSVLSYSFNSGGLHNVVLVISNASSCNGNDTLNYSFVLYNKPVAAFTYDYRPVYFADDNIHFFDQSTGATQWYWDFADTAHSTLQNPSHSYAFAGVYSVCLTVNNANNCPDEVCHDVPITETIYVPNVFTPNGDKVNEEFRVYYSGILDMDVSIFDRWGEVVAHWHGLDGSWDGTYKGKPVKEDVYVYYITAKGYWDPDIVKVGRVTVLR